MFTRFTGMIIVPVWLLAMGWLFAHDVWPRWTAQEPPSLRVADWLSDENRRAQFSLMLDEDRIGTIWTDYMGDEQSVQRHDLIWVERFPLAIAPLRIMVDSTFTGAGLLDEFHLQLVNHSMVPSELHGERFHADFSFTFRQGPLEQSFKLPLTDGTLIAEAFAPSTRLTGLTVGQTWRMQVFNPISALTGVGDRFHSMLVEVTGEELIHTPDGMVPCYIVESDNARIWVDHDGALRLQEMRLPLLGKLRIRREASYDQPAKIRARKHTFRRYHSENQP